LNEEQAERAEAVAERSMGCIDLLEGGEKEPLFLLHPALSIWSFCTSAFSATSVVKLFLFEPQLNERKAMKARPFHFGLIWLIVLGGCAGKPGKTVPDQAPLGPEFGPKKSMRWK